MGPLQPSPGKKDPDWEGQSGSLNYPVRGQGGQTERDRVHTDFREIKGERERDGES